MKSTLTEMVRTSVSEILKGIGVSIPAHILEFDTDTQLAKIQIAVEFIDVGGKSFEIAPIVNMPVHFSGGDFILEHQIDAGDEGLIIVSQRCIDGWKEQGGVAPQTVIRKLGMQDGLFIPGFRSKPNAVTDFQNDGIRLRNKAGDQFIWLKNNGDNLIQNSNGSFLLKADGSEKGSNSFGSYELEPSGNFVVNGVTIDVSGNITTMATIVAGTVSAASIAGGGKELAGHTHSQGNDSGGDTQANTSPNL